MPSRIPWREGDLALVHSHGQSRFVVVGIGGAHWSPRLVAEAVEDRKMIFRGASCLLTRPSARPGDWARRKDHLSPHLYRITRIKGTQFIFDATYTQIDGTTHRCLEHGPIQNWVLVEAPIRTEETMFEACWEKGDLALVAGDAATIWTVTDAGMGKPRGQMSLEVPDGSKGLSGYSEEALSRPPIGPGTWIRCLHPGDHGYRARVVGVAANSLTLDRREVRIEGTAEPCCSTVHPKYWVPVETPAHLDDCSVLEDQVAKLQEVWRRENVARMEAEAEVEALKRKEPTGAWRVKNLESDLRFMRDEATKLRDENKEWKGRAESLGAEVSEHAQTIIELREVLAKAENDHKSALGQRDKEMEGRWSAQEKLRDAWRDLERMEARVVRLEGDPEPPKVVM